VVVVGAERVAAPGKLAHRAQDRYLGGEACRRSTIALEQHGIVSSIGR
jgi:hypothetical protein